MYEVKHIQLPFIAYGVMGNYDESSGEYDYMAAYAVTEVKDIPEGMESWTLPAQIYADFPCTMSTIRQTYDAIYGQWLPASTYRHAPSPVLELYDENFDNGDPNAGFWLCIPIEPH